MEQLWETIFIPAKLSGDPHQPAEVGREIDQQSYSLLRDAVKASTAAETQRHPSRDQQADRTGCSELYRRCWQREALSQQGDWKHPHAWWWWPVDEAGLERVHSAHDASSGQEGWIANTNVHVQWEAPAAAAVPVRQFRNCLELFGTVPKQFRNSFGTIPEPEPEPKPEPTVAAVAKAAKATPAKQVCTPLKHSPT